MDEKQILKQLNQLKEVKPRKQWVNMTKAELFNQQQEKAAASLISKAFAPLQKPALALASIGIIALIMGSAMIYSPQLVEVNEPMPIVEPASSEPQFAQSLQQLSDNLNKINSKLSNLQQTEDPSRMLAMTAAIGATAQQGQKTVESLATSTSDPQTLAALDKLEQGFEQTSQSVQNFVQVQINELNNNKQYLSAANQKRLGKAERAFEQDDYALSIMWLQKINVE